MQKDKYVHTDKDKQDDLLFIRRFSQTFEDKFSSRLSLSVYNIGELDGLDEYLYCVFVDVLHQAETVYAMNTPSGNEMIWITTGINPNGVTNNLIARTYNIVYQKKVNGRLMNKFYDYSINTFDEVIKRFELFLSSPTQLNSSEPE